MGMQKRVPRSAIAAFCPSAPLIVCGSTGSQDAGHNQLELFSLDLARQGADLPVVGSPIKLADSVTSLTWGSFGISSGRAQHGLVAGALANGHLCLWDPASMVGRAEGAGKSILDWKPFAQGHVHAVSMSALSPNLLAAAGSSGEVLVFDIANPAAPAGTSGDATVALYQPQPAGAAAPAEALCVHFNNQNNKIIAIGFSNGHTHVYDFRNKKKFLGIKDDNSVRRTASLAWSPGRDTHLILASEDDRSPTLQFWDLRKASSPTLEFVGHSRGVTSVAWCPQDPTVLVSCGKDYRTIVWDVPSGEQLGGMDTLDGPARQVAWSPLAPGVFLSAQQTGVAVASFTGTASFTDATTDRATGQQVMQTYSKPLPRAPTWMRRRCCARFGFGGKLAMVQPGAPDAPRVVRLTAVCLESSLKVHSEQFESAISGDLRAYCYQKSVEESGEEAQSWSFIQVLFDGDAAKTSLLAKLGFETGQAPPPPTVGEQVDAAAAALQSAAAISPAADAHDDDFFNREMPAAAEGGDFFESALSGKDGNHTDAPAWASELDSIEEDGEAEPEVQRALFVGHHAAAVDVCLRRDRMADALVIAHVSGDPDLWRRTLSAYMKACPRPYMRVVEAQLKEDFDTLIKARPVGVWQETLAILVTYTSRDAFTRLCAMLAQRLQSSGMAHAATLCFICSGDVDSAVRLWLRSCTSSSPSVAMLQSVLEKSIALGRATSHSKASESLSDLITNYALHLASIGCPRSAMTYLELLPGEASPSSAVLKDRIYRSAIHEVSDFAQAPPFPFELSDVQQSEEGRAAAVAMQQAAYQQYGAAYGADAQYAAGPQGYDQYGQKQYGAAAAAYGGYHEAPRTAPSYQPPGPAGAYQAPAPIPAPSQYQQQHAPAPSAYPASAGGGYAPQQPAPQAYAPSRPYGQAAATAAYHAPPTAQPQQPPRQQFAAAPYSAPAGPAAPAYAAPPASSPSYGGQPAHRQPQAFQPQQPAPTYGSQAPGGYGAGAPAPPAAAPAPSHPPAFQPVHAAPPAAPLPGLVPGMQPAQAPPAPLPRAQPPPPPPGPPADCTIFSFSAANLPAEHHVVYQSMMSLFQACEVVSGQGVARKREMDDNAKRLGTLFWKLSEGQLSGDVVRALHSMAAALNAGDWAGASQVQVQLTGSHWDECASWLTACKRLIKTRMQLG